MTRVNRLKPIIEFKDQQQKQCLQDMADSKTRWENQQTQLDNLHLYQNEYHINQAHTNDTNALSVMQLVEERRFIDQLENTIKQQVLIVQQAEREYQIKQRHWLKMKNDVTAVEHLVENLHHEEIKLADKQEQKILDEYGLRRQLKQ